MDKVLLLGAFVCASVFLWMQPASAQTTTQCTTTELDLMCDSDLSEVLVGIDSNGQKICEARRNTLIFGGKVENDDIINLGPEDGLRSCQVLVSVDDMHFNICDAGNTQCGFYRDGFADSTHWGNNHYAGAQAYAENITSGDNERYRVTCRYGFMPSNDGSPIWFDGACSYIAICLEDRDD